MEEFDIKMGKHLCIYIRKFLTQNLLKRGYRYRIYIFSYFRNPFVMPFYHLNGFVGFLHVAIHLLAANVLVC